MSSHLSKISVQSYSIFLSLVDLNSKSLNDSQQNIPQALNYEKNFEK
jgi:hypothetical protein